MLLMLSPDPNSRAMSSDLYKKMEVLRPTPSTAQEMTKFHSNDVVQWLASVPIPASQ